MQLKNTPQKHETRNQDRNVQQLQSAEITARSSDKKRSTYKLPRHRKESTVDSKRKVLFPVGTILMLAVTTLLLMMMVSNYVLINEYTQEVGELRADLQGIAQEKDKLSNELDKKNDYMTMEKYASSVLGMESSQTADQVYIEVGDDDSIEVFEVEEDGTRGVIATVMSALTQNFIEAWNTLTDSE